MTVGVAPTVPIVATIRDARYGRLRFPTITDALKETLGAVEADARGRPFDLALPVHGAPGDNNLEAAAERLRRQVRGYFNNLRALAEPAYLEVHFDPDLNGWYTAKGGELEYAEGGPTLSDYKLALRDCVQLGGQRTHRVARKITTRDRRLSSVPCDFKGRVFSDMAAQDALAEIALPVGAYDVVSCRAPTATADRATIDGDVKLVEGVDSGDVLHFEQPEGDHHLADVVVLDRRGGTAPAYTLAGDADPQAVYGWEELYGPDQERTLTDVPVVENGVCRVRWVPATQALALDAYVPDVGYVEQWRVTVWRDSPAGTEAQFVTFVSATVARLTWEAATVALTLTIGSDRCELFVTLGRGWTGPRVEAYATWAAAGKPGVALRPVPFASGATTLGRSDGTDAVVDTTDFGAFTGLEPWAYLLPQSPGLPLHIGVMRQPVKVIGRADTAGYGSARNGVSVVARDGTTAEGYVSATFGMGARGDEEADATRLGQLNLIEAHAVPDLVER